MNLPGTRGKTPSGKLLLLNLVQVALLGLSLCVSVSFSTLGLIIQEIGSFQILPEEELLTTLW